MRSDISFYKTLACMTSLRWCFAAALWCGLSVRTWAQGEGVTIERGTQVDFDKGILRSANALRKKGKLLSAKAVQALYNAPQPEKIVLPDPSTQALPSREVYRRARAAYMRVGWLHKCPDCSHWHLLMAGGYAIAPGGVVATVAHLLEPPEGAKRAFLIAVTAEGKTLPVTSILAVDDQLDACILRVDGFGGAPLALNESVAPGDAAFCFSDPIGERGFFTAGIVNRFYWEDADGGDVDTLAGSRRLRLDVSAKWAPGSSGAAVLDQAGNAIGHVCSVSDFAFPGDEEIEETFQGHVAPDEGEEPLEEGAGSDGRFQVHTAIPARGIMLLVRDMENPTPTARAPAKEASPAVNVRVGHPAPPLTPGQWIQGEPVEAFEKGTIYVVEFWATWCSPCIESIPHLTKLQDQYRDQRVVVIGQNCMEEHQDKVARFVKKMGKKMTYRVALDDVSENESGLMSAAWLEASGQEGIPTAFVVDRQGRLAWIGHPLELDEVLAAIVDGTFDIEEAAKEQAKLEAAEEALAEAEDMFWDGELDEALKQVDDIISNHPDQAPEGLLLKYLILVEKEDFKSAEELGEAMWSAMQDDVDMLVEAAALLSDTEQPREADLLLAEKMVLRANEMTGGEDLYVLDILAIVYVKAGKYDQALSTADEMIVLARAEKDEAAESWGQVTRLRALVGKGDYTAAGVYGEKIIVAAKDDPEWLGEILFSLLGDQDVAPGRVQLVETLADRAAALNKSPDVKELVSQVRTMAQLRKQDAAEVEADQE